MATTTVDINTSTAFSREAVEALSRSRNEPAWMLERRLQAFATWESLPMPSRSDEEWRRTDLRRLKLERFTAAPSTEGRVDSLEALAGGAGSADQMQFGESSQRAGLSVARDASTVYHEVDPSLASQGVIFTDLATAVIEHEDLVKQYFMTEAVPADFGKFEALHAAMWQTGAFLYVPKGVTVSLPFRSFALAQQPGSALFTHSLVVVEEGAEAFFVDAYQSETQEEQSFTSAVVELFLKDDAKLRYVQVQDWGRHVMLS
jgi:Fe-S cluster assembly protein SufD